MLEIPSGEKPRMDYNSVSIPEKTGEKRNWSKYNMGQMFEPKLFPYYLRGLVDIIAQMEDEEKDGCVAGRPPIPLDDAIFCMILKTYLKTMNRKIISYFEDACDNHLIRKSPQPSTLGKYFGDNEMTKISEVLLYLSARPLGHLETTFAIDSSGFRTTCYDHWNEEKWRKRAKGDQKENIWKKMHIVIGVRSNVVVAMKVTDSHGEGTGDTSQFDPLIRDVYQYYSPSIMLGDKAYLSRSNFELASKMGFLMFSPPKKNTTRRAGKAVSWGEMMTFCTHHHDKFYQIYHQRSNVETTFMAMKKRLGETISNKSNVGQVNELYCKAIAYNISLLSNAYFTLGLECPFVDYGALSMNSGDCL